MRNFRSNDGFTLIEILMVMVILGILAGIALPAFLHQQEKATDVAAKVDVRTAQTAMGIYRTENGDYACGASSACVDSLRKIESTVPSNGLSITGYDGTGPAAADAFRATAPGGQQRTFWAAQQASARSRGCALNGSPQAGACRVQAGDTAGSW